MIITEKGKVIRLMDEQNGTSKAGNAWTAREFVIEVNDEGFIGPVHFKAFGNDATVLADVQIGDEVEVRYKPQAREYNGRWYDENKVFRVSKVHGPAVNQPTETKEDENHDLPF